MQPILPPLLHSLHTSRVRKAHPRTQERYWGTHFVELIEHRYRRRPVHAGVGDTHAIFERLGPHGRDVLASRVDMGLNHYANDRAFARLELFANIIEHFGLVIVVFRGIPVCVCT